MVGVYEVGIRLSRSDLRTLKTRDDLLMVDVVRIVVYPAC